MHRKYNLSIIIRNLLLIFILIQFSKLYAQEARSGPAGTYNLNDCIHFAFKNQPRVKAADAR